MEYVHQQVSLMERDKVIHRLFNELQAHLEDDARNVEGEIVPNDPIARIAEQIDKLHHDYTDHAGF